ncbi:hypothetical protein MPTK1_3g04630 [Marchantia polymorpha subsp. ruderalis]|uniref:F-box domain-containing protein n=2 Tax=Marchantia polymorpha TaxID=3197 RepID=A0AAF6AXF6_MARPO|nr:hypothetical protein MARPO_0022s0066 [Marchantia polymorpha]BBN04440.1 hypothetical protein Mp_3g04630 [Marchantia polymorpha subsp. ruderalis]|eukprot:PTQ43962.1 hypothetical protein MARPO_0022s0066 [Marchantia polymorpha]
MGSGFSIPSSFLGRSKSINSASALECSALENHERTLNSDVWKQLPIDILLGNIVTKLPFSSLLRFCCVSPAWKSFIYSMENSPLSHSSKSILIHSLAPLRVLNTHIDGGRWVYPYPTSADLRVLASAGGLLCTSTEEFGQLLVWNPITQAKRQLQIPLDSQYGNALYHVFEFQSEIQDTDRWVTKLISSGSLRVGLNYNPRTNHYQLIIAALCRNSAGATLIFDSRTKAWRNGPEIPQGIRFELNSVSSRCGRYFYCAMHAKAVYHLLELDLDLDCWTQFMIQPRLGIPEGLIEQRGIVLLLTRSQPGRETFSVFELHVRLGMPDVYQWKERTARHVPGMLSKQVYGAMRTREKNLLMKIGDRYVQCLGKGNLLYFVGTSVEKCVVDAQTESFLKSEEGAFYTFVPIRSQCRLMSFVRVWVHDTCADRLMHLTDWAFEGYDDFNLISFQLFNPSLCSRP